MRLLARGSQMSTAIRLFQPGPDITEPGSVADIADRYLAKLATRVIAEDYTQAALDRLRRYLDCFVNWTDPNERQAIRLGRLQVGECRQAHFDAWLTAHFHRWKKASTRIDAIGSILACFNWAEEAELIERNPFHRPRKMKLVKVPRTPMRPGHYVAIMRQAMARRDRRHQGSLPLRRGLLFGWRTGCRTCELRELRWEDIAWEERCVRIKHHKTRHSTGEDRVFGLGDKVYRMLRRLWLRRRPGQVYVFENNRKTPWNKDTWTRHFSRYARSAGIPKEVTAYCTRHGFAVEQVKKGIDTKSIADQLGHKGTRMVDAVYAASTRHETDHLRNVADRAERKRPRSEAELERDRRRAQDLRRRREQAEMPLFEMIPPDE